MADITLTAEVRETTGKEVARKIRAAGKIPAVVYGRGKASTPIVLDPRELERLLQQSEAGLNTLIDLELGGAGGKAKRVVLVKELQREPVRGSLLHVDLYEVDLTQKVSVEVPIHLVGRPKGVELGGVLDHTLREVEVECLPRAIPDTIEVDVSELDIGDVVHVRDLPLPEGVELVSDPELAVALVSAPAAEEAAPEAELAEGEVPAAEGAPAEESAEEGESKEGE